MAKRERHFKFLPFLLGVGLTAVGLTYVFGAFQIIPDSAPWIGYLDDSVVIVALWIIYRRARRALEKYSKK